MRYIGSKTNLLHEIAKVVPLSKANKQSFCGIFGGTGAVGYIFSKNSGIITMCHTLSVLAKKRLIISVEFSHSGKTNFGWGIGYSELS